MADNFRRLLLHACQGDRDAIEQILIRYAPLINNASMISGTLDEDLRQLIYLRIIASIHNFKV